MVLLKRQEVQVVLEVAVDWEAVGQVVGGMWAGYTVASVVVACTSVVAVEEHCST